MEGARVEGRICHKRDEKNKYSTTWDGKIYKLNLHTLYNEESKVTMTTAVRGYIVLVCTYTRDNYEQITLATFCFLREALPMRTRQALPTVNINTSNWAHNIF